MGDTSDWLTLQIKWFVVSLFLFVWQRLVDSDTATKVVFLFYIIDKYRFLNFSLWIDWLLVYVPLHNIVFKVKGRGIKASTDHVLVLWKTYLHPNHEN